MSLASNLWATALIGYKAWLFRRNIGAHLHEGGKRTMLEKILALLVESGAFYCGVWVIYIVSNATPALRGAFATFIEDGVPQLSGIYPTVIIVIVCLQKSHCDRQFTYARPVSPSTPNPETMIEPWRTTRLDSVIVHGDSFEPMSSGSTSEFEMPERGKEKSADIA
ncbi:hypothetical protein OF83DRAFT_1174081 [Amylostereum chailletii]|nr:hypothetical protein OF83DRAFT_1174081 [Amylostereum chailletii]